MDRLDRRKVLIRKLYKKIAQETIGNDTSIPIKFRINETGIGTSYCGTRRDKYGTRYILIVLDLKALNDRVKNGYITSYYKGRVNRLNRYIVKNRHNTLRFVLYHETRHAYQRVNNLRDDMSKEQAEKDADEWALAHIQKEA